MKFLPDSIEERLALALHEVSSPQKVRLLTYIHSNPNKFTHQIASSCAVGFPPNRLSELNKEVLPRYGLYMRCVKPEKWLKNRHGDTSFVHQWRLEIIGETMKAA